jgi:two-component system, sensor histidine kinase and response regulator
LTDGSVRDVSAVARVVLGEHGDVCRLIGVCMDITERKRAEGEIIRARNLAQETARVKSDFLANVNHELRTPMNAILGLTEVLLDTGLTEDQRDYLGIVKRSADSLLMLIENTLTFSDYDDAKLERVPFDVEESVCESVKLFVDAAHQKEITFRCHVSPDVPKQLEGDPKRLRKALRLLIDNAVKFTKSGEISVDVEQEACDGREIKLRFTVRDTGIGIPADRQEMIFSPFTQIDSSRTRAYGGTGLGLTVCRRLVEMLGGSLWVLSAPGGGSAFHFTAQFTTHQLGVDFPKLTSSNALGV